MEDDRTAQSRRDRTAGGPAGRTKAAAPGLANVINPAAASDAPRPAGPLSVAGRVGWTLLIVALPILILTSLAVGLSYVRLSHGPISLKFLAGPLAKGIASELPGLDVRIDDVVLRIADGGGLEFRLKGVQLLESDGDLIASAPEAATQISTAGLWSGRIVPSRVALIEPRLNLSISDRGDVSLSFSASDAGTPSDSGAAQQAPAGNGPGRERGVKRLDIAQVLTEASSRARQQLDATSFLREIGLRNAKIVVETRGEKTVWQVPEASVDLEHTRRSSTIAGVATVASSHGPWSIAFRTEESEKTRMLVLKTTIRDLVPKSIESALPGFGLLRGLDLPVATDATFELAAGGELRSATAGIEFGRGRIDVTGQGAGGLAIDGGLLQITYDAATRRLELLPSPVRWSDGQVTLKGMMTGGSTSDGRSGWVFDMAASEGSFRAADLGLAPVPLQSWTSVGHWLPGSGRLQLTRFNLKAGGADITGNGEIDTARGLEGMRIDSSSGPMPLATFKTLWPRAVAPGARSWVGERLTRATVKGGTFRYLSGSHLKDQAPVAAASGQPRVSLAIEFADTVLKPIPQMSPVEAPKALVRLENETVEISMPDAAVALGPNRRVALKGGHFAIADFYQRAPSGEITFKVQSALPPVLELIDQEPLALLRKAGYALEGADGKVEGQFRIVVPLIAGLEPEDIKIEGKARVFDARAKQMIAGLDVQGATVNFDIAEHAVDAKGEMLLSGVLAKLGWQHIFDAPHDKQPPLRLTATLDNSDRNQLGLDVNHVIQGEVPVEITVTRATKDHSGVRVRADLSNAEVMIEPLAWKKQPGRAAYLQFDVAKGKVHKTELQNFKIAGDDVAIEGSVGLGADNLPREFHFPDFSLNVITRLDVQGRITASNIWDVKARGKTLDGREFFRSLFSVGQIGDRPSKPQKPRDGVDVEAEIDTVLGFSDTSLKNLRLTLSKRADKLVAMEAKGTLDSGKPLVAVVRNEPKEPRRLLADSTDAGQAFKLIGFYPNAQGGRVRLEVNLDGKGPAEKTGVLWVDDFAILGDPVVAEVVASVGVDAADQGGQRVKRQIVRQSFAFDRMKAPFSVGHGQFVLADSYLKGPLLGATIRGKVDYRAKTVTLGGTYVPLQGLNNVLGDIPLLGQLLSGPRGEGIFGITFAIQGPMASPQVIVNPLSLVAPGIFREMFQMTPIDPSVQIRDERGQTRPVETRTRASSTPAEAPVPAPQADRPNAVRQPIDGWSSETRPPVPKAK